MKYIRIWNILSREYCFDEKEGYNFRKLDQVLDFLIENELCPYLELGNKPSLFMYTPERSIKDDTTGVEERYKYDVFCKIIKELCVHLINRYGEEELENGILSSGMIRHLKLQKKRAHITGILILYTRF